MSFFILLQININKEAIWLCYSHFNRVKHYNEKFKENILRDVILFELRIKENLGINVVSSDWMNRWHLALKIAERCLMELLRKETENVFASLDTAFENFLETEIFSGNIQEVRARVIMNGKHWAEGPQEGRDSKWHLRDKWVLIALGLWLYQIERDKGGKKERTNWN